MEKYPAPHSYSPRTNVVVANPKSPRVLGCAVFLFSHREWTARWSSLVIGTMLFAQTSDWSRSRLVIKYSMSIGANFYYSLVSASWEGGYVSGDEKRIFVYKGLILLSYIIKFLTLVLLIRGNKRLSHKDQVSEYSTCEWNYRQYRISPRRVQTGRETRWRLKSGGLTICEIFNLAIPACWLDVFKDSRLVLITCFLLAIHRKYYPRVTSRKYSYLLEACN